MDFRSINCTVHPFLSLSAMVLLCNTTKFKLRGRERQDWLIQLANREGAWPKRPYECFWSKVGVSRIGQG